MDELTAKSPGSIQKMFSSIAQSYDTANSVLSFGIHHYWKKKLVKQSGAKKGDAILDCATGTGDLAFLFEKVTQSGDSIIGCDFCEPMLQVAKNKASEKNSKVTFECADLTKLPYSNSQFQIATVSFGIRNVKDPLLGLSEMYRVVKPGGKVFVLEFGQTQVPILKTLYSVYSHHILPMMGGWISGQKSAYRYLNDSSSVFPCGDQFLELAKKAGNFQSVSYQPLFGGVVYLYQLQR